MEEYKTIVAGSRSIADYELVKKAINEVDWDISVLYSGDADGVDQLAIRWAAENDIPVERRPPKYDEYGGNRAPLERNKQMAREADALIAVWNGSSTGTEHMIRQARNRGLQISIHRTDTSSLGDF